ncbi:PspC domain-containing protein [Lentzea tibetensis]|uniref:PspC domain-containing protein n=1 Tax=Lentzea tibetensis TaxID=2591470 RepID=A0A563EGL8_9PSEU|nr:PspC domain-containing protein [Lentzea tibetensis]TWP45202.1 PspC domain-containing protein [Lentzea tibetensis]
MCANTTPGKLNIVSGTVGAAGVGDTLRDFWAHRPIRPKRGRKIGGVATGIALRYQIDPVIVRIAFVAAALTGGAGFLLYVLGWLWLPEEGDTVSPAEALLHRGHSSMASGTTVLLGLLLFPATGAILGGGFEVFLTVALAGAGIYLLQKNRGHLEPATITTEMPITPAPGAPSWDPLGAAPFAWDLPEPSAPPPPPAPKRKKSRIGLATLGIAVLVVAGSAVAGAWSSWFSPVHVIGLIVGVLGLGLIAGAFAGGTRGLIGLVLPLSIVGLIMTSVEFDSQAQFGDLNASPSSIADVKERYEVSAGSVVLDLRKLPNSGEVKTAVEVSVGEARVHVPKNADVQVTCASNVGATVKCLNESAEGRSPRLDVTDNGPDGPGGLKIELDVYANVGEVSVIRD